MTKLAFEREGGDFSANSPMMRAYRETFVSCSFNHLRSTFDYRAGGVRPPIFEPCRAARPSWSHTLPPARIGKWVFPRKVYLIVKGSHDTWSMRLPTFKHVLML